MTAIATTSVAFSRNCLRCKGFLAHHNQNLKPYATHIFELICIYFLFDSTVTEILFENFLLVTENLF